MNENYKKAGLRNFTLGQLANCKTTLNRLIKSDHLINYEKAIINDALLKLNEMNKLPIHIRHKIFGQNNNFKKYKDGTKNNSKNL